MEELMYSAEPSKDFTTLILLLIALISLLGFLFLLQTNKIAQLKGGYRQIGFLLGSLTALIVLATTIFTFLNLRTIQPIKLYKTYMITYHGKINYKDIRQAGIFYDQQKSFINPQKIIRKDNILVVEKRNKQVMLFAADNYELLPLVEKINQQMDRNRKR